MPAGCTDGSQNGDESDVDCGGSCPACENGKSCGGPGDCQSGRCSGGTCSACTSSSQCDEGKYCAGGTCLPKKAAGEPCLAPAQCASGSCPPQDGVCCSTSCTGTCRSCLKSKTGKENGTCAVVAAGTDPDGECTNDIACNGAGDCIGCGYDPPAPGGPCPGVCTGGCTSDGTCTIDCLGIDACVNDTISCPPDFRCVVNCHGTGACDGATITCPTLYQCDVDCDSTGACSSSTIQCGSGPCSLSCNESGDCDGAQVICGVNACSAACSPGSAKPALSCSNACSCTGCDAAARPRRRSGHPPLPLGPRPSPPPC